MPRHRFTAEEARKGGQTRAAQPTAAPARRQGGRTRAAQPDFPIHCARAGRAGYDATLAHYGLAFVLGKIADYRRAHPTRPEAWLRAELLALGLVEGDDQDFVREVELQLGAQRAYLDCVLPLERLVIEVDGPYHDATADAARDAALADLGYQVLRLSATTIRRTPREARAQLHTALGIREREVA